MDKDKKHTLCLNMNICEATSKAREVGRGITRRAWGTRPHLIIPTNTTECMILIDHKGTTKQRWQPTADDLTADDWYVYG